MEICDTALDCPVPVGEQWTSNATVILHVCVCVSLYALLYLRLYNSEVGTFQRSCFTVKEWGKKILVQINSINQPVEGMKLKRFGQVPSILPSRV